MLIFVAANTYLNVEGSGECFIKAHLDIRVIMRFFHLDGRFVYIIPGYIVTFCPSPPNPASFLLAQGM